jgi:hypothetical protein
VRILWSIPPGDPIPDEPICTRHGRCRLARSKRCPARSEKNPFATSFPAADAEKGQDQ